MATGYKDTSFTGNTDNMKEEQTDKKEDKQTFPYGSTQQANACELYETIEMTASTQEVDNKRFKCSHKSMVYAFRIILTATVIGTLTAVIILFESTSRTSCGSLPSTLHGSINASKTTHGATANYECDFGYQITSGSSTRTCYDGVWTGCEGVCSPIHCGSLAVISYGVISAPVTTHGGTATYTCVVGYKITSGNSSRTCVDGAWDGVQPACTIKVCGSFPSISHESINASKTTHGAKVNYECDFGYQITSGSTTRTCYDGFWTGCQAVCSASHCGSLPSILHGSINGSEKTHGAKLNYECDFGYQMTSGSSTRTCYDGVWTGCEAVCSASRCGSLAAITYGVISAPVTRHGGTATYTCVVGYEITSGNSSRTCVDGAWDGVQPICTIKDCGSLPSILHGSIDASETTHGAKVIYECDFGYQITSGSSRRTCYDGFWIGCEAVCSPIPNVGCYIEGSSELYRGRTQYTTNDIFCQRWDVQAPQTHDMTDKEKFPDASITEAGNYCRNPDSEPEPWCYTTENDIRWEVCGIPKC